MMVSMSLRTHICATRPQWEHSDIFTFTLTALWSLNSPARKHKYMFYDKKASYDATALSYSWHVMHVCIYKLSINQYQIISDIYTL